LEEFPQSAIESAGGFRVVQYRGGILDLASLATLLSAGEPDRAGTYDPVHAVVFADAGRNLGVIVDRIIDIAEDVVEVRRESGVAGLLGSAVIGGKVTDLLDIRSIIEMAGSAGIGRLAQAVAGCEPAVEVA
jgi:two-component system chemotaxis sensor kinase CheA